MSPFALISVADKTGLIPFAQGLLSRGFRLLSTGGTAETLRQAGIEVTDVAAYTASPEVLGGRVKTLHPLVHGGILYDRDNAEHLATVARLGIAPIALVAVNLYRFGEEALAKGLPLAQAIEHIDIGGPTMLRAAAKNFRFVLPLIDPGDYERVLTALGPGPVAPVPQVAESLRTHLAAKTFARIAAYDEMIAAYFKAATSSEKTVDQPHGEAMPALWHSNLERLASLRYGENPHQHAALYAPKASSPQGFAAAKVLQGKELSYNNIVDLDAAAALCREFNEPAAVIVKHTNPAGVAVAPSLATAFGRALAADPKSAFGGIVALNREVDAATAETLATIFLEAIVAPGFSEEALARLGAKKNLRLIESPLAVKGALTPQYAVRSVAGGLLVQTSDEALTSQWQVVSLRQPTPAEQRDMAFAWAVVKHVKSNAIVYAKGEVTLSVGAGQMSRIDAANFAALKAEAERGAGILRGSVLASDAFFPFADTVELAARYGVRAIIQPGGSVRDADSIAAANAADIAMVLTNERHFRH